MPRHTWLIISTYAVLSALIAGWVYVDAFNNALEADRQAGKVRLSEASSRLRGQLDVYRALVNIAARDAKMALALERADESVVTAELARLSLTYGAWEVDLANNSGQAIASSSPEHLGYVYSTRLIQAARNGRLGYAIERDQGQRLVRFSRGILNQHREVVGAVVVSANLAALEFEWPVTPEPIVFFDDTGLSISANRLGLLMLSTEAGKDFPAFPLSERSSFVGTDLWTFADGSGNASEVQVLSAPVPQLQMTAQILLSTENARATALLRFGLALALLLAFSLVAAILIQQRRRLAFESRQSATLERRVEERTKELKDTQDKLVEASNLAALGRLSAGISHELNQPLAAILNYAENGKRLIAKSRKSEAEENLTQITKQIRRITRIITNLRTFAKQEHAPLERVDLTQVVNRVLEQAREDITASGAELKLSVPEYALEVMGGNVRLEQVVLNLITNALDAMNHADEKVLEIHLEEKDQTVALHIRDTGSGIEEPDRVFEPFYTTKELGASKGLGMGLALSFGLVSNFGGTLTCRNHKSGAEFVMTLPKADGST